MMESWGQTHAGLVRANNEDAQGSVEEVGFYVVADGLGGASAGERASRTTVDILEAEVRRAGATVNLAGIAKAIELANRNVWDEALSDPALRGMGTTVTAALIRDGQLGIANVGDSRAYLFRNDRLKCLTVDHTWVNELARERGVSADSFRNHPYRHVLTRAVGGEDRVEVETFPGIPFTPGDILLLCSDGLHGVLTDEVIERLLRGRASVQEKAGRLIEATLDHGAPDNVTVVLVRHPGEP